MRERERQREREGGRGGGESEIEEYRDNLKICGREKGRRRGIRNGRNAKTDSEASKSFCHADTHHHSTWSTVRWKRL